MISGIIEDYAALSLEAVRRESRAVAQARAAETAPSGSERHADKAAEEVSVAA